MANTALKTSLKTDLIEMIKGNIADSNEYYLFVSRINEFEDNPATTTITESDVNPPSIKETSRNVYDTYRNMIFLKRLRSENMRLVVRRINWTYGAAYTAYSETTDLADKDYYVMTTEYNVYKCMRSNGASEIMPTGRSSNVFSTGDGYQWKYIYTVPEDYLGFLTLDYMPVFMADETTPEQKDVQNKSRRASIDSISIDPTKSPTFSKAFRAERFFKDYGANFYADLGATANLAGSTYVTFDIIGEQESPADGFYNNYAIYVTAGPGIGQYFRILDFRRGGSGVSYYYASVYPSIERDLLPSPPGAANVASKFKIVPYVVVDGDGTDAIVVPNVSSARKIVSTTIVNPGRDYTYARPRIVSDASSISIGSQVLELNNSLSASLSTPNGHGASAIKEFNPANLLIAIEVDGTEGGKISTRNNYRQFGVLKSPYLYGGETLAGSEEDIALKALIKKQPSKNDLYSNSTFIVGNYVFGKESRATAKILDSEKIPGTEYRRLFLTDVVGKFRFADDASTKSRVYYRTGFTGTFATGDSAFQYQSTEGITLSAQGKIHTFDTGERSVVIDTTYGSFVEGKPISFLGASGAYGISLAGVLDVDQDLGELLGQVSFGVTSGTEFLEFGGDEIFGRLASTEFVPTEVEDLGEYSAVTKLTLINSSPFTDGVIDSSSAIDGTIHQTDTTTQKKVTGRIVDFTVAGGIGFTGIVQLTNLTGVFNSSDQLRFSPSGSTAETNLTTVTINAIQNPDIDIGSGNLLYIENVRPIERNIEQSEEFKIVIGF